MIARTEVSCFARTAPTAGLRRSGFDLRALWGLALFAILTVVFGALAAVETAPKHGGWLKPFKFSVSFVVYFATLAVLARLLPDAVRHRQWFTLMLGTALLASILEIAWLGSAAALGVPSHYNTEPPWNAFYPIAGLLAVYLIAVLAVVGCAFGLVRQPALRPGLRLSIGLGGVLTFVLTLITASALASNPGHFVGVEPDGAARWWLFGWSTTVGDMRPAHFLATHAIQVLPVAALLWALLRLPRPNLAATAVAAGYTAMTLTLFYEGISGRPPLSTFALF